MKTSIIKVGNSRGIRILRPIFNQCGFQEEVELEGQDSQPIIRSFRRTREGWDQAFKSMSKNGDDTLIDDIECSRDESEWEWK